MNEHIPIEQLSRLIDSDLSLTERVAVLAHLVRCPACAERQSRLIDVAAPLRELPPTHWTPAHSDNAIAHAARRHETRGAIILTATASLIATATVTALAVLTPLWGTVALLVTVAIGLVATVAPLGPDAPHAILALVIAAILAPLLAYPLARWR